jgi:hypothetical protein
MKEFEIGQRVSANKISTYKIIHKHDVFSGWCNVEEPLLLVYDDNTDTEKYLAYTEYKNMKYEYDKSITIISRGYFNRKMYLNEDKPRYDIRNEETGEFIERCYLHNGSWIVV